MDLLTAGDWAEIHSALTDVTDTFFKEQTIVINRYTREIDQFSESPGNFTEVPFLGYVEPDGESQDNLIAVDGKSIQTRIKVSFDFRKLRTAGLTTLDGVSVLDPANDFLRVHGFKYDITGIDHEGLTPQGYVLVVVYCKYDAKQWE